MKQTDLIRKVMAKVTKSLADSDYVDELIIAGLIGEEGGMLFLGDNALMFAHNMYGVIADDMIARKVIPKGFRDLFVRRFADIGPGAFELLYKQYKHLMDHNTAAWDGPMLMVLTLAEPTHDPELTLAMMADLVAGLDKLIPKKRGTLQ